MKLKKKHTANISYKIYTLINNNNKKCLPYDLLQKDLKQGPL